MLVEPSMSSAIRRPGYETSSRANPVSGSASATAKNGMPARNSSSGTCRSSASGDRRITGSTAGSATCVRPR